MAFMKDRVGEAFQEETKYDPDRLDGGQPAWDERPPATKHAESPISIVTLPEPRRTDASLWSVLESRRSRRSFDEDAILDLSVLSGLLWAAQGITARHGEHSFRTAPSAGALYPVETYLSVRRVGGLRAGIYHFRPLSFDLEYLRDRDHSRDLAGSALRQAMVMNAQVTFLWSAVVGRCRWKYRQRAYRYIYLDAGHVGQNLALAAEAYGLGCCMVGAFYDDHVNALLGIDGTEETVLYMAAVGRAQKP